MKRLIVTSIALGTLLLIGPAALAQLPDAKPGECYARVAVPPAYETTTEQVLRQAGSERIEIVPARYDSIEEIVLLEDVVQGGKVVLTAGTRFTRSEFNDAVRRYSGSEYSGSGSMSGLSGRGELMTERLEAVPATYEWVEERVQVTPAKTSWKKGRGPIERLDNATGEIMCMVEEPAVYNTVRTKVVKTPPTTRTFRVPVKYQAVSLRKVAQPEAQRRIEIPASYETVTKRTMVRDGRLEWLPVLCETNLSPSVVTNVQRALTRAGFDAGPVDGVIGAATLSALRSYQKAKGLASGHLTMETIRSLGVSM